MNQQNNQSIINENMQNEMFTAEVAALTDLETQDAAEIKGGVVTIEYLILGSHLSSPR